ncbi:MAG: ankyrin repeat domain-containing protein [Coxiellaceae bacterium]|nr:ankyrin repeat domain-containing protein [Coxiellaceae bacterium]
MPIYRHYKLCSFFSKRTARKPPADFQAALLTAYITQNSDDIEELTDKGAGLQYDIRDIAETAFSIRLTKAIKENDTEKVNDLITESKAHHYDLNSHLKSKITPLHFAVLNSREQHIERSLTIIRNLLDAGCDLNKVSCEKAAYTPLISAARKALPAIVTLLLENGADKELKDSSGKTALDFVSIKLASTGGEPIDTHRLETVRDLLSDAPTQHPGPAT